MCCCNEVSACTENLLVLLRKLPSMYFVLSPCLLSLWNRDQRFSRGVTALKKSRNIFRTFLVHLPYMGGTDYPLFSSKLIFPNP